MLAFSQEHWGYLIPWVRRAAYGGAQAALTGAGHVWRSRRRYAYFAVMLILCWSISTLWRTQQLHQVALTVNKWERFMTVMEHANKPVECVAWRATQLCSPYGPRQPSEDLPCRSFVQTASGYCECEGNVIVSMVGCGMHAFTCFDRCRELGHEGFQLPESITCKGAQAGAGAARLLQERDGGKGAHGEDAKLTSGVELLLGQEAGKAPAQSMSTSHLLASADSADIGEVEAHAGRADAARSASPAALPSSSAAGVAEMGGSDNPDPKLWEALVGPVRAHTPQPGPLPGKRTDHVGGDWVLEGKPLPATGVAALRQGLRDYMHAVAGEGRQQVLGGIGPPPWQQGRGVVVVSGGLRYMVSAWMGLAMLRRTGCSLPVEMWFPLLEYPTPGLVDALRRQGVTPRAFAVADLDQEGFSLKVAAILLSRFTEVLFLDADNFAVRDPSPLFDSPQYGAAGCVFWRDYWDSNVAPELHAVLGLDRASMPPDSFEAGQMLIDKRHHWLGLRVALYLNYYHATFFDLFTDYFGWGDKETFYYAFRAAGEPTYYNPTPTGSVGLVRPFCRRYKSRAMCRDIFTGNTMVQYDLGQGGPTNGSGQGAAPTPLFLHSNLNKWTLQQPDDFDAHYTRRWRVLQPEGEDFPAWSIRMLGVDLERFAYGALRSFRCAPWFDEYYAVRLRHGEHADTHLRPLGGLHGLVAGVEFHQLYRTGYGGSYGDLFMRSQLDEVLHALGQLDRRALVPLKRVLRSYVWGGGRLVALMQAVGRRVRAVLLALSM